MIYVFWTIAFLLLLAMLLSVLPSVLLRLWAAMHPESRYARIECRQKVSRICKRIATVVGAIALLAFIYFYSRYIG